VAIVINKYQKSESPEIAIIGLHGWLGDEHSFMPVAKSVGLENAKWFMPRAPYKTDLGKGFTWFSGTDDSGWKYEKTIELMETLTENVFNDGFPPEKLFVIGFSMGAGLAIEVGVRMSIPIGGIIPIAGMVKFPDEIRKEATAESRKTPFLILHGKRDTIVPIKSSVDMVDLLKELNYCAGMEVYDAEHQIPIEAVKLIRSFIKKHANPQV